jgi:purine-binding chemotaxis protein CheW
MIENRRNTDFNGQLNTAEQNLQQFVSFSLGEQDYCVDIMAVREIKAWTGTTRLPNSPDYMRGVINLRGAIVPVIDLRLRFGNGATEPTAASVIIIVQVAGAQTGLLVDAVSDIITVSRNDLAPIPELETENKNPYFSGLITVHEKLVAIISLENLLVAENSGRSSEQSSRTVPDMTMQNETFALRA